MKKLIGRLRKSKTAEGELTQAISDKPLVPKPDKPSIKNPLEWVKYGVKYLKKWQLALIAVVVLLLIVLAIPQTRYPVLGLVIKKDLTLTVVDSVTNKPVSEAQVELRGSAQKTDSEGKVVFKQMSVGPAMASVTKKYYDTAVLDAFVGLSSVDNPEIKLNAQGTPLSLKVVNAITKQPVQNVSVKAGESEARSDEEGLTVLVVPVGMEEVELTLSGDGFAGVTKTLAVADIEGKETMVEIAPAGKIYFLSKQSGKIDIVKTNLDGNDRQIVLAGTGYEKDGETVLLASRDWRYLALKAKRDNKKDNNAVYLIDTSNDKLTMIDDGNADFTLNGWAGKNLIFQVQRNEVQYYQADKFRLKSYNAESQKLTTLDRNSETGSLGYVSVAEDKVVYLKPNYNGYSNCGLFPNGVYIINPDGTAKQTIMEANTSDSRLGYSFTVNPGRIYYQTEEGQCSGQSVAKHFDYEFGGKLAPLSEADFQRGENNQKAYLVSPNSKQVFWAESRDGKNVFFIGDMKMENGKEVARLEEFTVYGWYGNEYVLLSKKGSELYIMSKDGGEPVKISDYHKPSYDYRGYGYGYGGL